LERAEAAIARKSSGTEAWRDRTCESEGDEQIRDVLVEQVRAAIVATEVQYDDAFKRQVEKIARK